MNRPLLLLALLAGGCCPPLAETPTDDYVKTVKDPPPPPSRAGSDIAREVVVSFVDATSAEDFEAVYALLTGDLRARYSPEKLAADHGAADRAPGNTLARIRASLQSGEALIVEDDRAWLPLGGGLAVRLRREGATWRIAALE